MRRAALLLSCALALAGCSHLLPHASSNTPSPFASFEEAQAAAGKVVAFQTRLPELRTLGFDWQAGKNVTVIPYPDVLARLAPYSGVPMDKLDPGIRQCVLDQASCRGYLFHFEKQERDREGGFWADFFNVRRLTKVRGWSFDALVVVSGETVLFRNWGGQANIDRVERQVNPLGPFQPAGEAAGAVLIR
jgi:hypothetical protein